MRSTTFAQIPDAPRNAKIISLIAGLLKERAWTQMTGIYAYVTAGGLLTLLEAAEKAKLELAHSWIFGLDDCLTQPAAIEVAQTLPNSDLKVCSLLGGGCRFHPKVLHLGSDEGADAMLIGSSNLTDNALRSNAETVTIMRAESQLDVLHLQSIVNQVAALGHDPSAAELAAYTKAYKVARRHHAAVAKLTRGVERNAGVHITGAIAGAGGLDPTVATTCWIEVGKNTAQGRELEIKAEQALFFKLHLAHGARQARRFLLSDGSRPELNFKYQGNAMWRLQMTNEVPEVRTGLRPFVKGTLGRSPYVAVFKRIDGGMYSLRFVDQSSSEYKALQTSAQAEGTFGETSSRAYGWS